MGINVYNIPSLNFDDSPLTIDWTGESNLLEPIIKSDFRCSLDL